MDKTNGSIDGLDDLPTTQHRESLEAQKLAKILYRTIYTSCRVTVDNEKAVSAQNCLQKMSAWCVERASYPPVVELLSSAISRQVTTVVEFHLICEVVFGILEQIDIKTMHQYRPALVTLSQSDTESVALPEGVFRKKVTGDAKDLIRFMDDESIVWTPKHKGDSLAIRTISERVHTAQEMAPHVDGLLTWLQDRNWPPYKRCAEQLGRFPELTVDILKKRYLHAPIDDLEWQQHMVELVEDYIPIGPLWESLENEIKALALRDKDGGESEELAEVAERWVEAFTEWRSTQQ